MPQSNSTTIGAVVPDYALVRRIGKGGYGEVWLARGVTGNYRAVGDLNNGQPNPKFTYIGSYFVPVIGPNGSKHESFKGVVRWTIPAPRQQNWWLGVWVQAGPKSPNEGKTSNNGAVLQLP